MKRRRRSSGLPLPWERSGALAGGALLRSRVRLAVIATVIAVGAVFLFNFTVERQRIRRTYATIAEVERAVHDFDIEVGRCPEGTDELLRPPRSVSRFIREVPKDGWGRELWIRCPGQRGEPANVVSAGPSGSFLVDDNLR